MFPPQVWAQAATPSEPVQAAAALPVQNPPANPPATNTDPKNDEKTDRQILRDALHLASWKVGSIVRAKLPGILKFRLSDDFAYFQPYAHCGNPFEGKTPAEVSLETAVEILTAAQLAYANFIKGRESEIGKITYEYFLEGVDKNNPDIVSANNVKCQPIFSRPQGFFEGSGYGESVGKLMKFLSEEGKGFLSPPMGNLIGKKKDSPLTVLELRDTLLVIHSLRNYTRLLGLAEKIQGKRASELPLPELALPATAGEKLARMDAREASIIANSLMTKLPPNVLKAMNSAEGIPRFVECSKKAEVCQVPANNSAVDKGSYCLCDAKEENARLMEEEIILSLQPPDPKDPKSRPHSAYLEGMRKLSIKGLLIELSVANQMLPKHKKFDLSKISEVSEEKRSSFKGTPVSLAAKMKNVGLERYLKLYSALNTFDEKHWWIENFTKAVDDLALKYRDGVESFPVPNDTNDKAFYEKADSLARSAVSLYGLDALKKPGQDYAKVSGAQMEATGYLMTSKFSERVREGDRVQGQDFASHFAEKLKLWSLLIQNDLSKWGDEAYAKRNEIIQQMISQVIIYAYSDALAIYVNTFFSSRGMGDFTLFWDAKYRNEWEGFLNLPENKLSIEKHASEITAKLMQYPGFDQKFDPEGVADKIAAERVRQVKPMLEEAVRADQTVQYMHQHELNAKGVPAMFPGLPYVPGWVYPWSHYNYNYRESLISDVSKAPACFQLPDGYSRENQYPMFGMDPAFGWNEGTDAGSLAELTDSTKMRDYEHLKKGLSSLINRRAKDLAIHLRKKGYTDAWVKANFAQKVAYPDKSERFHTVANVDALAREIVLKFEETLEADSAKDRGLVAQLRTSALEPIKEWMNDDEAAKEAYAENGEVFAQKLWNKYLRAVLLNYKKDDAAWREQFVSIVNIIENEEIFFKKPNADKLIEVYEKYSKKEASISEVISRLNEIASNEKMKQGNSLANPALWVTFCQGFTGPNNENCLQWVSSHTAVYENEYAKRYFDNRVWYATQNILNQRGFLNHFGKNGEKFDPATTLEKLKKEAVPEKQYFVWQGGKWVRSDKPTPNYNEGSGTDWVWHAPGLPPEGRVNPMAPTNGPDGKPLPIVPSSPHKKAQAALSVLEATRMDLLRYAFFGYERQDFEGEAVIPKVETPAAPPAPATVPAAATAPSVAAGPATAPATPAVAPATPAEPPKPAPIPVVLAKKELTPNAQAMLGEIDKFLQEISERGHGKEVKNSGSNKKKKNDKNFDLMKWMKRTFTDADTYDTAWSWFLKEMTKAPKKKTEGETPATMGALVSTEPTFSYFDISSLKGLVEETSKNLKLFEGWQKRTTDYRNVVISAIQSGDQEKIAKAYPEARIVLGDHADFLVAGNEGSATEWADENLYKELSAELLPPFADFKAKLRVLIARVTTPRVDPGKELEDIEKLLTESEQALWDMNREKKGLWTRVELTRRWLGKWPLKLIGYESDGKFDRQELIQKLGVQIDDLKERKRRAEEGVAAFNQTKNVLANYLPQVDQAKFAVVVLSNNSSIDIWQSYFHTQFLNSTKGRGGAKLPMTPAMILTDLNEVAGVSRVLVPVDAKVAKEYLEDVIGYCQAGRSDAHLLNFRKTFRAQILAELKMLAENPVKVSQLIADPSRKDDHLMPLRGAFSRLKSLWNLKQKDQAQKDMTFPQWIQAQFKSSFQQTAANALSLPEVDQICGLLEKRASDLMPEIDAVISDPKAKLSRLTMLKYYERVVQLSSDLFHGPLSQFGPLVVQGTPQKLVWFRHSPTQAILSTTEARRSSESVTLSLVNFFGKAKLTPDIIKKIVGEESDILWAPLLSEKPEERTAYIQTLSVKSRDELFAKLDTYLISLMAQIPLLAEMPGSMWGPLEQVIPDTPATDEKAEAKLETKPEGTQADGTKKASTPTTPRPTLPTRNPAPAVKKSATAATVPATTTPAGTTNSNSSSRVAPAEQRKGGAVASATQPNTSGVQATTVKGATTTATVPNTGAVTPVANEPALTTAPPPPDYTVLFEPSDKLSAYTYETWLKEMKRLLVLWVKLKDNPSFGGSAFMMQPTMGFKQLTGDIVRHFTQYTPFKVNKHHVSVLSKAESEALIKAISDRMTADFTAQIQMQNRTAAKAEGENTTVVPAPSVSVPAPELPTDAFSASMVEFDGYTNSERKQIVEDIRGIFASEMLRLEREHLTEVLRVAAEKQSLGIKQDKDGNQEGKEAEPVFEAQPFLRGNVAFQAVDIPREQTREQNLIEFYTHNFVLDPAHLDEKPTIKKDPVAHKSIGDWRAFYNARNREDRPCYVMDKEQRGFYWSWQPASKETEQAKAFKIWFENLATDPMAIEAYASRAKDAKDTGANSRLWDLYPTLAQFQASVKDTEGNTIPSLYEELGSLMELADRNARTNGLPKSYPYFLALLNWNFSHYGAKPEFGPGVHQELLKDQHRAALMMEMTDLLEWDLRDFDEWETLMKRQGKPADWKAIAESKRDFLMAIGDRRLGSTLVTSTYVQNPDIGPSYGYRPTPVHPDELKSFVAFGDQADEYQTWVTDPKSYLTSRANVTDQTERQLFNQMTSTSTELVGEWNLREGNPTVRNRMATYASRATQPFGGDYAKIDDSRANAIVNRAKSFEINTDGTEVKQLVAIREAWVDFRRTIDEMRSKYAFEGPTVLQVRGNSALIDGGWVISPESIDQLHSMLKKFGKQFSYPKEIPNPQDYSRSEFITRAARTAGEIAHWAAFNGRSEEESKRIKDLLGIISGYYTEEALKIDYYKGVEASGNDIVDKIRRMVALDVSGIVDEDDFNASEAKEAIRESQIAFFDNVSEFVNQYLPEGSSNETFRLLTELRNAPSDSRRFMENWVDPIVQIGVGVTVLAAMMSRMPGAAGGAFATGQAISLYVVGGYFAYQMVDEVLKYTVYTPEQLAILASIRDAQINGTFSLMKDETGLTVAAGVLANEEAWSSKTGWLIRGVTFLATMQMLRPFSLGWKGGRQVLRWARPEAYARWQFRRYLGRMGIAEAELKVNGSWKSLEEMQAIIAAAEERNIAQSLVHRSYGNTISDAWNGVKTRAAQGFRWITRKKASNNEGDFIKVLSEQRSFGGNFPIDGRMAKYYRKLIERRIQTADGGLDAMELGRLERALVESDHGFLSLDSLIAIHGGQDSVMSQLMPMWMRFAGVPESVYWMFSPTAKNLSRVQSAVQAGQYTRNLMAFQVLVEFRQTSDHNWMKLLEQLIQENPSKALDLEEVMTACFDEKHFLHAKLTGKAADPRNLDAGSRTQVQEVPRSGENALGLDKELREEVQSLHEVWTIASLPGAPASEEFKAAIKAMAQRDYGYFAYQLSNPKRKLYFSPGISSEDPATTPTSPTVPVETKSSWMGKHVETIATPVDMRYELSIQMNVTDDALRNSLAKYMGPKMTSESLEATMGELLRNGKISSAEADQMWKAVQATRAIELSEKLRTLPKSLGGTQGEQIDWGFFQNQFDRLLATPRPQRLTYAQARGFMFEGGATSSSKFITADTLDTFVAMRQADKVNKKLLREAEQVIRENLEASLIHGPLRVENLEAITGMPSEALLDDGMQNLLAGERTLSRSRYTDMVLGRTVTSDKMAPFSQRLEVLFSREVTTVTEAESLLGCSRYSSPEQIRQHAQIMRESFGKRIPTPEQMTERARPAVEWMEKEIAAGRQSPERMESWRESFMKVTSAEQRSQEIVSRINRSEQILIEGPAPQSSLTPSTGPSTGPTTGTPSSSSGVTVEVAPRAARAQNGISSASTPSAPAPATPEPFDYAASDLAQRWMQPGSKMIDYSLVEEASGRGARGMLADVNKELATAGLKNTDAMEASAQGLRFLQGVQVLEQLKTEGVISASEAIELFPMMVNAHAMVRIHPLRLSDGAAFEILAAFWLKATNRKLTLREVANPEWVYREFYPKFEEVNQGKGRYQNMFIRQEIMAAGEAVDVFIYQQAGFPFAQEYVEARGLEATLLQSESGLPLELLVNPEIISRPKVLARLLQGPQVSADDAAKDAEIIIQLFNDQGTNPSLSLSNLRRIAHEFAIRERNLYMREFWIKGKDNEAMLRRQIQEQRTRIERAHNRLKEWAGEGNEIPPIVRPDASPTQTPAVSAPAAPSNLVIPGEIPPPPPQPGTGGSGLIIP